MEYTQQLLDEVGLGGKRIQMTNVSAAMGAKFAQTAAEITNEIKELGPNPLGKADK